MLSRRQLLIASAAVIGGSVAVAVAVPTRSVGGGDDAANSPRPTSATALPESPASGSATSGVGGAPAPRPLQGLATRCSFGAFTGSTAAHAALETHVGASLKRYVMYQVMGTDGRSAFPAREASWCALTGHNLVIAWDVAASGPTFADIRAGRNDASLDAFFLACKAFTGRVVLRMWWEFNDPQGPTKPQNRILVSSPAEWIATWQYVYDRCKVANQCHNVDFFWCANGNDTGAYQLEAFYPGDSFVDEVGFDTYNDVRHSRWTEFDDKMAEPYERVAALHKTAPVSIGETGTADSGGPPGTSKAEWLNGLYTSTQFPRMRYIDFFSVAKESDWRIDSTTAAVAVDRRFLRGAPAVAATS